MCRSRAAIESIPLDSRVANEVDRTLGAAMARLSPEQRLEAFSIHCELIMDIYLAGVDLQVRDQ